MAPLISPSPLEGQSVSIPASQLHLKPPSLSLPRSQVLAGAVEDPGLLVASPGLCGPFVKGHRPSMGQGSWSRQALAQRASSTVRVATSWSPKSNDNLKPLDSTMVDLVNGGVCEEASELVSVCRLRVTLVFLMVSVQGKLKLGNTAHKYKLSKFCLHF